MPVSPKGLRRIYARLLQLAARNGPPKPKERAILNRFCADHQIPIDEALSIENRIRRGVTPELAHKDEEQSLLVDSLIALAAADGVLEDSEREVLMDLAKTIGLPETLLTDRIEAHLDGFSLIESDSEENHFEENNSEESPAEDRAPKLDPKKSSQARSERAEQKASKSSGQAESSSSQSYSNSGARVAQVLFFIALADNSSDSDPQALGRWADELNVDPLRFDELIDAGRAGTGLVIGKAGSAERETLISWLPTVAAQGSILTVARARRLRKILKTLDLSPEDMAAKLDQRAIRLQDGARDALTKSAKSQAASQSQKPSRNARLASQSALERSGRLALIDAEVIPLLVLDNQPIPVAALSSNFCGFRGLSPGPHFLQFPGLNARSWFQIEAEGITILLFDLESRSFTLIPHSPENLELRTTLNSPRGDAILLPAPPNETWKQLSDPLLSRRIMPVQVFPVSEPRQGQSRLDQIWKIEHKGDSASFLAEMAATYIEGENGITESAKRWFHILQAIYNCGERRPQEDPVLFEKIVDLLIAQLQNIRGGPRGAIVEHARYLAEDLIDSEHPTLVAAGRRWKEFLAQVS
jgi:DnaJ-domain-containing protein 1